jgi:hypothetical protein
MYKGMMGPEHGAKAAFGSGKAADARRMKAGAVKTAKLPTSLAELEKVLYGHDQEGHPDEIAAVVETSA